MELESLRLPFYVALVSTAGICLDRFAHSSGCAVVLLFLDILFYRRSFIVHEPLAAG